MNRTSTPQMTLILMIAAITLLGATYAAAQVGETQIVFDCDSLDGVSITGGADWPGTVLELNTDERFVSEGDASIQLSGVSPADATGNSYLSLAIDIDPIDLEGQALLFDAWTDLPETTRALYLRAYNSDGDCVLSYLNWGGPIDEEKTTVTLTRGFGDVLAWEPGMVESDDLSEVTRLRFWIGTSEADAPLGFYVDNIRVGESLIRSFNEIEEPKQLFPRTPLVQAGQAAGRIIVPADEAWGDAAVALQSLIGEHAGVAPEIVPADQVTDEEMHSEATIVIGNVVINPRMRALYGRGYIFPDDYYPGEGGYEVRTVHDPWGTGNNVLSIGASDPSGALAGVEALREHMQAGDDLVLEPTLLVELSADAQRRWGRAFEVDPDDDWLQQRKDQAERDLEVGLHGGLFSRMVSVGQDYQRSGKDGYARAFAWLAKRAKQHRDTDPQTFGGPWGMDSDFRSADVFAAWDVVEDSPALTDEDRWDVTQVLFQWMQEAVAPSATPSFGSRHPRHNHNTFPSLGCMYAGEYFQKYYDAGEGARWLEIADDTFQSQAQLFKPHEDCNGYEWLTLYHTLRYCLARPHFEYFENGNARRSADFAIMVMDNLAYPVTYGDTGVFSGWWSEMPFLHGAEWYYRDGRYSWATDKKREVSGRLSTGWYAADTEPVEPTDLIGAKAFPLEPMFFDSFGGHEQMEPEQAFDMVVFRDGFDPDDQYLLLNGLNVGGHHHYDGNSISRITDNGRIWLADASYMASLPKYHSTALVLRDGESAPMPDFAEMQHVRDLPSVGFSETALRDYAGVDWSRNIVWLKGDWFVVADEMQAQEAGDYSFRILWQTIGDVELTDDGLTVEQDGQHFAIRMTPELNFTLEHDEEYGQNWSSYQYIDDAVVHKLTGIWNGRLEAGEQVTLFTLLHASGESTSPLHLSRVGSDAVAVTGGEEPALVAVGGTNNRMDLTDEARVSGHAALLRPGLLALMDATSVEYQGQMLDLYGGQDVEMALGDGDQTIFPNAGRTAEPSESSYQEFSTEVAMISDDVVRGMIDAVIAAAPPAARQAVATDAAPQMETLWTWAEKLESYLLTGNRGMFGAVDTGVQVSAQPDPLEHNVFSGPEGAPNVVENVLDGATAGTADAVMWDDEQPVTIDLDFDRVYDIDSITVKAWFATSSSKNKLFQLQDITIEASDDGFEDDARELVDFTDTEMHANWGLPVHEPQEYVFDELDVSARDLRLHFTPRPGTAVYITEIEVRGTGAGIEELALRPDSNVPVHSFTALHAVDVDSDGADEIIAGSTSGEVSLFDGDGSRLWSAETGGRVLSVSSATLAGHDRPAIIAGGTSASLFAFSADGDELWSFEMPRYKNAGVITTVFPADLDGDGSDEIIAGTESWRYYAFDADGTEIWRVESVRKSTVGAAADLDGDGADEVVAGTEYHYWPVYDSDGSRMFRYSPRTGPGCNGVAIGDITGDDAPEIVFAGLDSFVHTITADGSLLWKFGTGDSVSAVTVLSGEGEARVAAASRGFNVYGFTADGSVAWRRDLGSPLVDMTSLSTGAGERVVTVAENGAVIAIDALDGALLGRAETARAGLAVTAADLDGDGSEEVVVSSRDGNLTALR
ncbi:MAG: PQQ-binding-like beta-propeller repeat protein [Armatimonadota bacterium]